MFDWQTGEEHWETRPRWQAGQYSSEPPEPRFRIPRSVPRWLLIWIVVIVLAGGTVAGYLRWQAIQRGARLRQDIQATIDTESWARESRNLRLYQSLLDPEADPGWRDRQVQAFRSAQGTTPPEMTVAEVLLFGPDLAVAEVEVVGLHAGKSERLTPKTPYRITRAYRRTGGMWLETSIPAGQVWLDQQSLETDNLRFIVHHDDAARVRAMMPAVQNLYSRLLRDLRLSPPRGKRPLYIIMSVRPIGSELDDDPTYYDLSDLGPDTSVDAGQERLGALLMEEVMEVFAREAGELSFMVRAVGEWEYSEWLASHPANDPVADRIETSPLVLGAADRMVTLPFLPLTDSEWKTLREPSVRSAVGQALVSHIVESYGRERLPDIVRGAPRADGLYPLVNQVLNVSLVLRAPFGEFDAGWRTYALEHFTAQQGTFQSTTSSTRSELIRLLSDERWSIDHNRFATYAALFAPDADPEWLEQQHRRFATYRDFLRQTNGPMGLRLEDVVLRGNEALVRAEVLFPDPGSAPYEQIRVYRRYGDEWKWAGVLASFSGLTHQEDLGPLRWRFNRQDAEVVRSEMAPTEDFFWRVASDLTLVDHTRRWEPPVATLDIVPGYRVLDGQQGRMQAQIVSPTLGQIATGMEANHFYRLAAGSALARYVLAVAVGPPPAPTVFADAVHEAVIHREAEQFAPTPWVGPRRTFITELLESDEEVSLRSSPTWTERNVDPAVSYLYDAAVAYFVDTYGRHHLGNLVRRAESHPDWERLIPAVVGTPFTDFEAGWQAYLAAEYGDG